MASDLAYKDHLSDDQAERWALGDDHPEVRKECLEALKEDRAARDAAERKQELILPPDEDND